VFKVGHNLLPERVSLLELPALVREAVDCEVVRHM